MIRAALAPRALVALALLMGPAPAALAAETTTPSPVDEAVVDSKDPNYVRCRKIAVTGSLVKKERICKTNAEWAEAGEMARKNADDLITRNRPGQRFE